MPLGGCPFRVAPKVRTLTPTTSRSRLTTGHTTPAAKSPQRPLGLSGSPLADATSEHELPSSKAKKQEPHWGLLQGVDAVDSLMHEEVQRRKMLEQRERNRTCLQEQVAAVQRGREEMRESQVRWREKLQADADRWQEEEQVRRQRSTEAFRRHDEEQTRHLEELRRRRQDERRIHEELDSAVCRQAQLELKKQQEADARRKEKSRQQALEVAAAATAAAHLKVDRRREEGLRDGELMKQQIATLEEQDRRRTAQLDSIRARQEATMARMQSSHENVLLKRQQADEERANRWQAELQKKQDALLQEQERHRKQMQAESAAFLERQLEEHRKQRLQEREESVRRREETDRDAQVALAEEQSRKQARRSREKEHAECLKRQMVEANERPRRDQMNEVEKTLNREKLLRAQEPDTLGVLRRPR